MVPAHIKLSYGKPDALAGTNVECHGHACWHCNIIKSRHSNMPQSLMREGTPVRSLPACRRVFFLKKMLTFLGWFSNLDSNVSESV